MSQRGMTARQFAVADGCSHTLVNRALKQGRLKTLPDGTIDPSQAGGPWRKQNRTRGNSLGTKRSTGKVSGGVSAKPGETPEQAAERIIGTSGATMSQAEAERVKENYLALLRQLEYDQKSGAVVLVSDVSKAVGAEYARVRNRLLAIPAEQAPRLSRLTDPAEVQSALLRVITEVLEELTKDAPSA